MFTILECAKMSSDVYEGTHYLPVLTKKTSQGSLKEGVYRIPDNDVGIEENSKFYARLYIKFEFGKPQGAAIAMRGTIPSWSNIKADVVGWASAAYFMSFVVVHVLNPYSF